MRSKRVLVSAPYMQSAIDDYAEQLRRNGVEPVVPPVDERLDEEELDEWLDDVDAVICGDDAFTGEVLEAHPHLRAIVKWGTGIDSIDTEAARRLDISVRNTPDAFTGPVADTTMGFLLSFARRIPWVTEEMRAGAWQKRILPSLEECVLGVVGVGNIGREVARRAAVFGMETLGNDIEPVPEAFVSRTGVRMTELEPLLRESDFVTLHCALNPTSHRIVGEGELELMGEGAYLINTARGPLVDEEALVRALEEGDLAGAALDVFEEEPLPEESPLRAMENVLLSPHNANSSPSAWRRVHENSIRMLLEELES